MRGMGDRVRIELGVVTSKDKDAGGTYLSAKLLLHHLQQASELLILPFHSP